MKKNLSLLAMMCLVATLLAGCNFPLFETAVETPEIPASNLTMTKIVEQLSATPTLAPVLPNTFTNTPVPATATETTVPTNTPKNTKTPKAPTATSVPSRAGDTILAAYMAAPVLDGTWDEWKSPQMPLNSVVYGKGSWTGEDDLSASYRIGWDDNYLYLAIKVVDDVYVENATGDNMYKGDSLEVQLDTNYYGDFYTTSLNNDDYQLGLSGGKAGAGKYTLAGPGEAYLWAPYGMAGGRSKVKMAFSRGVNFDDKPAYRAEVAIPWSTFGITPYNGMTLGFAFSVSDNDNKSKNVQESMISNAPNRVSVLDPTLWRELVLVK